MKTFSYYFELYFGLILGLSIGILIFIYKPEFMFWKEAIKSFSEIGICAFGFLLTFLGIILQSESETIKWMKSREKLYEKFIFFNKKIVMVSFLLTLLSYLISNFGCNFLIYFFEDISIFKKIIISIWGGSVSLFLFETFYFINVFYYLIKK